LAKRVLLADQSAAVLRAVTSFLQEDPTITVVGSTQQAGDVVCRARDQKPDLVLLQFGLPGRPTRDVIAELHSLVPAPRVVVMSGDPHDGRAALQAGADGFVSETENGDWALESLRCAVSKAAAKSTEGKTN
jgi:two-component system response regulator EvgA